MKVTVCQLRDDPEDFKKDWAALSAHAKSERSELVLLPEMPFNSWVARTSNYDPAVWARSVADSREWLERLDKLASAAVLGTVPIVHEGQNRNEGFVWDRIIGYRYAHEKYYLPNENLFWEATWYGRGEKSFYPVNAAGASIGYLICTEIWFAEHARAYGQAGAQLIANPRATEKFSVDKWLVGGRAAAVSAGAFCLSSNKGGVDSGGIHWGGAGWIIDPDGEVLGRTTEENPFLSLDIDLQIADNAKTTYPRYVPD